MAEHAVIEAKPNDVDHDLRISHPWWGALVHHIANPRLVC